MKLAAERSHVGDEGGVVKSAAALMQEVLAADEKLKAAIDAAERNPRKVPKIFEAYDALDAAEEAYRRASLSPVGTRS